MKVLKYFVDHLPLFLSFLRLFDQSTKYKVLFKHKEMSSLREYFKKQRREKWTKGWEVSEDQNLFPQKVFFQKPYKIIVGHPKHVLHLDQVTWSGVLEHICIHLLR